MLEVPLTSSPEQLFSIRLGSNTYDVRVILNSRTGLWTISLSQGEKNIVLGVPLVGGVDIFKQYNIPISNAYVINMENPVADPSKTNLGTSCKLMILTDEEIEAALLEAELKAQRLKGRDV